MDFKEFFASLPEAEQERFAHLAGSTAGYIRTHLIAPANRRRVPRKDLMDGLHKALNAFGVSCDKDSLVGYFYNSE